MQSERVPRDGGQKRPITCEKSPVTGKRGLRTPTYLFHEVLDDGPAQLHALFHHQPGEIMLCVLKHHVHRALLLVVVCTIAGPRVSSLLTYVQHQAPPTPPPLSLPCPVLQHCPASCQPQREKRVSRRFSVLVSALFCSIVAPAAQFSCSLQLTTYDRQSRLHGSSNTRLADWTCSSSRAANFDRMPSWSA